MQKIMFNDFFGLTEAVLSGRKTQTRRIAYEFGYRVDKCKIWGNNITYMDGKMQVLDEFPNPRYKVGEVVAVAQSYKQIVEQQSDAEKVLDLYKVGKKYLTMEEMGAGWTNKMFVRADLMPNHICITGVRAERLQDISDEDCLAEGVRMIDSDPESPIYDVYFYENDERVFMFDSPKDAYAALIDRVWGKGKWQSNPLVFIYEFELVD